MRLGHGILPKDEARTFLGIIFTAMAVTFSQGLMIPWMAALEAGHVTPLMNSLTTSDTYFGLLVAMAFVGRLSRHIGLRKLVLTALVSGLLTIWMFVWIHNTEWWLLFRFLFGLSLGAIHFGTQSWLGRLTTPENRGKQMALYGLATGVGFATGPMFLSAGKAATWLPFALSGLAFILSLVISFRLPGELERDGEVNKPPVITLRHLSRIALPALALPLVFGFMESGLNGNLPLFAVRVHMSLGVVSASLAAFVLGSLVLQMPLGYISDLWGRRMVLISCSMIGVVLFGILPVVRGKPVVFIALFFIVGAFLGTLFSLSLGFLHDLVGPVHLPLANQLAVTQLGLGLMIGPVMGGIAMTWLGPSGMFWAISCLYLVYAGVSVTWRLPILHHRSPETNI